MNTNYLILLLALVCLNHASGQSIDNYRWEKRLVFILNPPGQNPLEHSQVRAFTKYEKEMLERDLLVWVLSEATVYDLKGQPIDLHPKEVPNNKFKGLILIGKDGGIKLKERFIVSPTRIFDLIDGMPMRRTEIKNSIKN